MKQLQKHEKNRKMCSINVVCNHSCSCSLHMRRLSSQKHVPGCADPPGVAAGNSRSTWRKTLPCINTVPVKMSAGKVSRRVKYSAPQGCKGGDKIRRVRRAAGRWCQKIRQLGQPGNVCRRVRSAAAPLHRAQIIIYAGRGLRPSFTFCIECTLALLYALCSGSSVPFFL